ncbi:MAG: B12-binding domain-containing radical SAM protein, partial [Lentisphaerae bacterium]|nr:B12-binding domain-containing radical SAM protein [Lentisphaerota bacterium]
PNVSNPSAPSAPPREISLPLGLYYRNGKEIAHTPPFELTRDLNDLPMIDRDLTRWELYAHENGNFKYTPGTYTMVGRDCWWGKCAFCSWTTIYSNWRTRAPESLLDEIGTLIDRYPIKEIFDDTGCFPAGKWLRQFCEGMIERGYHKRVVMGCNMIPGVLDQDLYDLMGKANFRFVLFGLESADQATLDRINKCGKAKDIENSMRMAKAAGLEPHVTCMVGYPWETRQQAEATVNQTKDMFRAGRIDSLQATVVIPYPGTPLFKECDEKGWLKTKDWDRYDMREPIMKTAMTDEEVLSLTRGIYKSFLTPRFVLRKLLAIRRWADVVFYCRAARRVLGHLLDFRG